MSLHFVGEPAQVTEPPVRQAHDGPVPGREPGRTQPPRLRRCRAGVCTFSREFYPLKALAGCPVQGVFGQVNEGIYKLLQESDELTCLRPRQAGVQAVVSSAPRAVPLTARNYRLRRI